MKTAENLRSQADHARKRSDAAKQGEYPRYGPSVHAQHAESLELFADTVEKNADAGSDAETEYDRRRARRVAGLENKAAALAVKSNELRVSSFEAVKHRPFGQPIVMNSRGRTLLNQVNKANQRDRKAFEVGEQARDVAHRAAGSAMRTDIDSDDPNAPAKIRERVAELEARQEQMKAANREAKKAGKGRAHASWELSNNNANLRRLRARLVEVEALQGMEERDETFGACRVWTDYDAGRVFVETPGKNEAATKILRGRGWCWSRYAGCWTRKMTANAVVVAFREVGPALEGVYA